MCPVSGVGGLGWASPWMVRAHQQLKSHSDDKALQKTPVLTPVHVRQTRNEREPESACCFLPRATRRGRRPGLQRCRKQQAKQAEAKCLAAR